MKITRTLTLNIPETPGSQVECGNGLVVTRGHDGKWHRFPSLHMTDAQLAERAIRVVSRAPGAQSTDGVYGEWEGSASDRWRS